MIRKGDIFLIVFIVAVILISYGWNIYTYGNYGDKEGIATIEIDGKLYGKYDLKTVKDQTLDLNLPAGEKSVVEFKDSKVRVLDVNCPDKVCQKTGWVSKPGEMIVCLPFHIIIKISGDRQDVDVNAF